jgi:hypothetical protein
LDAANGDEDWDFLKIAMGVVMSDGADDTKNYEVGYCKPPEASKFKKGKSGNSNGRPKGSVSWKTTIDKVLSKKLPITVGGKLKRITKRELIVETAVNEALSRRNFRPLKELGAFNEPAEAPFEYPVSFTLKLEEDPPEANDPDAM